MTKAKQLFNFSSNPLDVTLQSVADLYESVSFGLAETYVSDEHFFDSIFCRGAYGFFVFAAPAQQLVGMARVLSDDKVCSWVAELCVHPTYQKMGIGSQLVDMIILRFGHTAIYLEAFAEQTEFFVKKGILPKKKLVACSRAARFSKNDVSLRKRFTH